MAETNPDPEIRSSRTVQCRIVYSYDRSNFLVRIHLSFMGAVLEAYCPLIRFWTSSLMSNWDKDFLGLVSIQATISDLSSVKT